MRQGERMCVNMDVLNAKGQHSLVNTPKADTPSVHGTNISDQVWPNNKRTGLTTQTRCSGPERALCPEETRVLWRQGGPPKTSSDSVVASAFLYSVVCWSSSITEGDEELDKINKEVQLAPGPSMQEAEDRRVLVKLTSMLDHEPAAVTL